MKGRDIIYIVIIIAIMSFFMNDCSRSAMVESEKITISDTIWNITEKDTIIINTIYEDTIIKKPQYIDSKPPIDGRNDSLRLYTGLYLLDFGSVIWKANVSGHLEDISFSGKYEIPERTITKHSIGTVTKTVETTKLSRWNLYGGVQGIASPNYFDVGPVADLRIGRMQYGYGYGLVNKTHVVKVSVKVF